MCHITATKIRGRYINSENYFLDLITSICFIHMSTTSPHPKLLQQDLKSLLFTYSLESRLIFFISLLEDSSIKLYFYSNSSLGVYLFINLTDEEKKINIF